MKSKHEIRKQEILESAFRIWGSCRYINTSLTDLASDQNLTKQALYRYFSSKEKIETAMEEAALAVYRQHVQNLLLKLSEITGDEFIRTYTDENIHFVARNRLYLGFLAYRYRGCTREPEVVREQMKAFAALAMKNAGVPGVGLRYLNSLTLMMVHRKPGTGSDNSGWEEIWNKGFGSGSEIRQPDYKRIFSDASTVKYDVMAEDPLVQAVFETVVEEAGNGISLGKIARKAGLTKSSLYNYWPGKEAMLKDVLNRQIAMFSLLFDDFSAGYSRPEDRFFSYLAFTGTFLRRTPEILNYLQRVMSYGIEMPHDKSIMEETFIRPMASLMESELLNLHGYKPGELLGLVNLSGVNEIKHHLAEGSVRIHIEQGLKDLYLLIMGGISAIRRTM
jgi:AcrR family transcriptional regulator